MQGRLKYPVLLACLVTYTNATLKIRSKGQVDYGNENPKLRPIQEAKTFRPCLDVLQKKFAMESY